jgi:hypothetical protein
MAKIISISIIGSLLINGSFHASEQSSRRSTLCISLKAVVLAAPLMYYSGKYLINSVTKQLVTRWVARENDKLLCKATRIDRNNNRVDFSQSPWREVVEHDTVPEELQKKIDATMHKPDVIQALTFLYHDTTLLQYLYARRICQQNGITFMSEQLTRNDLLELARGRPDNSPSQRVFTIKAVPGYIFKMAHNEHGRREANNIGRIIFAKYLLKQIHDTANYAISITMPLKYLYQLQPSQSKYAPITPQALVVAQMMDLSNMRDLSLSWSAYNLGNTLFRAGYADHLKDNVFEELDSMSSIVIIDTEPFRFPLDQINYPELLQYWDEHNLNLGQRTATLCLKTCRLNIKNS